MQGPDFPTGGLIVDPREAIAEAYTTGRGSFRVRARWHKEETGRGTYQVVVTEIPWLVQKMRLVERIAELINEKKLPLVAEMRDESAEDIRIVIEPRSRTVDPELMMESLFKLTELESRIPLNMNVLVKGRIPKVVGLAEALTEWLAHRREVLLRRSRFRLGQIEHRLEVLGGYLVAYLNLDKVIKIIRNEDEPKPVLMKTFKLTDVQADAILNMRLRNLRKLEEMEIRKEDKELRAERKSLSELIGSEKEQWKKVAAEIKAVREKFGPKTPLGKRRTGFAEAPEHDEAAIEEALVEREPVTVVVSEKGWIRALRGTVTDLSGDRVQGRRRAEIRVSRPRPPRNAWCSPPTAAATRSMPQSFPGGRGHGEPVRLFIDLEQEARPRRRLPPPGRAQIPGRERAGQGLRGARRTNASPTPARASRSSTSRRRTPRARSPLVEGELVAAIGENRKMLIFPLDQVPEMARGRGVRLQRYKDGGLSDLKTFKAQRRPRLDRHRRARLLAHAQGACRLARQPRRRRPPRAEGFPRTNKFGQPPANGSG